MRAWRDWLTQGKQANNGGCRRGNGRSGAADFSVNAQTPAVTMAPLHHRGEMPALGIVGVAAAIV